MPLPFIPAPKSNDHQGWASGPKDQVDPLRRLIGAAAARRGNPREEFPYTQRYVPTKSDGKAVYNSTVETCARRRLLVDQRMQRKIIWSWIL